MQFCDVMIAQCTRWQRRLATLTESIGEQIVEVFPVRFPWIRWRQLVFPQEEAKQRTLEHLRRDVTAVVAVGQRGQMHVAVDQGFISHWSTVIGQLSGMKSGHCAQTGTTPSSSTSVKNDWAKGESDVRRRTSFQSTCFSLLTSALLSQVMRISLLFSLWMPRKGDVQSPMEDLIAF
jgi:hypothetical protein